MPRRFGWKWRKYTLQWHVFVTKKKEQNCRTDDNRNIFHKSRRARLYLKLVSGTATWNDRRKQPAYYLRNFDRNDSKLRFADLIGKPPGLHVNTTKKISDRRQKTGHRCLAEDFYTEKMSGDSPVSTIAVSGKVLEAPVFQLNESPACGRWLRWPVAVVVLPSCFGLAD